MVKIFLLFIAMISGAIFSSMAAILAPKLPYIGCTPRTPTGKCPRHGIYPQSQTAQIYLPQTTHHVLWLSELFSSVIDSNFFMSLKIGPLFGILSSELTESQSSANDVSIISNVPFFRKWLLRHLAHLRSPLYFPVLRSIVILYR